MSISGECILKISGDNVDFSAIEKKLDFRASRTITKGKKIAIERYAPLSSWDYIKKIDDKQSFENGLKLFLLELHSKREMLQELSSTYEVCINCYIRSDYGQFGYELNKEILTLMDEIGLPVYFHLLSFGIAE